MYDATVAEWLSYSFLASRELEKKRTQSSISLSVEKDILRQMATVKKLKTLNDEAAFFEKGIKDKKVCGHCGENNAVIFFACSFYSL
jgi:hypothetical protein